MADMQINIKFLSIRRDFRQLDLLVLLIALALVLSTGWFGYEKYLGLRTLEESISASKNAAGKRIPAISSKRIGEINMAVMQLNLPWSELLSAIERNLSSNVALLGVAPNAEKKMVRIEGEAKHAEDMIEFVEQIERDPFFERASLLRHQINDSDRNRPYRFIMEANWR